jgi:recombination protein RecA
MPPKKKTAGESKSLAETLAELRKAGTRIGFDEISAEPEFWSTGNMAIDTITGGGIPKGKVTELAGPPASGKTTTAVSTAAGIMQEGGYVAFFDYERAIDKPYFRALGVDPNSEQFLYFTPRHLEEGANVFRSLVATGEIQMGIFDSVARMATEHELTAETGKVLVADRAKMMYQFLRQVIDPLADSNTSLVFLNHLLEKVDATFLGAQMAARGIKQYTSPGGNAIPFYASLRLQYKKIGDITKDEFNPLLNEDSKVRVGSKHEVYALKNKVGKPGGKAEVINVMGEGFSQVRTAVDLLVKYDLIKKNGAWFTAKEARLVETLGDKQIQGEDNLVAKISAEPLTKGTVITVAHEILQNAVDTAVVETAQEELPAEFAEQKGVFVG